MFVCVCLCTRYSAGVLWAEESYCDNIQCLKWASPDSGGPQQVNKLCVCSSPADVCLAEEEEGAGRGQTWRGWVNNRPHWRVAAAALQTGADAEAETERGEGQRGHTRGNPRPLMLFKAEHSTVFGKIKRISGVLNQSLLVWEDSYCCKR